MLVWLCYLDLALSLLELSYIPFFWLLLWAITLGNQKCLSDVELWLIWTLHHCPISDFSRYCGRKMQFSPVPCQSLCLVSPPKLAKLHKFSLTSSCNFFSLGEKNAFFCCLSNPFPCLSYEKSGRQSPQSVFWVFTIRWGN